MEIGQIHRILRANDWWNNILPPIIGFYFLGKIHGLNYAISIHETFFMFCLMISVAVFGFTLGEWSDIKDDKKVGKENHLDGKPLFLKAFILIASVILIGFSSWSLYLSTTMKTVVAGQLLCFVLYSVPPFRLKRFKYTSLLLDASYSGTLMYVLAFCQPQTVIHEPIVIAIIVWGFAKGARNFILHTLNDANNDKALNIQTIGNSSSQDKTLNRIKNLLIPIEIIAMLFILVLIEVHADYFVYSYVVVLVYASYHKSKSKLLGQYKFAANMNIYHEVAFLMVSVAVFSMNNMTAAVLIPVFAIFFPSIGFWFISGTKLVINKILSILKGAKS